VVEGAAEGDAAEPDGAAEALGAPLAAGDDAGLLQATTSRAMRAAEAVEGPRTRRVVDRGEDGVDMAALTSGRRTRFPAARPRCRDAPGVEILARGRANAPRA
jgi:hypothetical protein